MIYVLVKTLHLVAMVGWMAGMIAVPAVLARFGPEGPPPEPRARLLMAFGALTTPALLVVWAAGLTIATLGGWWDNTWLQAKLALVLVLSGLHGAMMAQLRRSAAGGPVPALARGLHWIVLALVAGAILLAVWKPARNVRSRAPSSARSSGSGEYPLRCRLARG